MTRCVCFFRSLVAFLCFMVACGGGPVFACVCLCLAAEVQGALTAPIAGLDLDEDDLLAELEGLEQEEANESLGEVPLQAAETDEKSQLRQLKDSME